MSDHIPEDNLVKILRCLPVRTLLQFRCVCKSWKQLIDSEPFMHQHLSVQKPRILVQYEDPKLMILDPQNLPSFDTIARERDFVIGTLHGVVCFFDFNDTFHLWNPSTRKWLTLPEADREHWSYYNSRDHVGDQDQTYTSFWIDPSTKEFKIILFNFTMRDYDLFYSSVQNEWKLSVLEGVDDRLGPMMGYRSIVIEGVAYWGAFIWENNIQNVIVICFDFVKERFDLIRTPYEHHEWDEPYVIYKWRGEISLVCMDLEKRCAIYSRQDDSWVNVFRFNVGSSVTRVLWVMGEREEMLENATIVATRMTDTRGMQVDGELILCDTRGGYVTLKGGLDDEFDKQIFVACDFVESLLFPCKWISD